MTKAKKGDKQNKRLQVTESTQMQKISDTSEDFDNEDKMDLDEPQVQEIPKGRQSLRVRKINSQVPGKITSVKRPSKQNTSIKSGLKECIQMKKNQNKCLVEESDDDKEDDEEDKEDNNDMGDKEDNNEMENKEDEESKGDEEEESTSVQKSPKDAQTSKSKLSLKNIKNEQIEESDDDKEDNEMEDKEDNEMEDKEDEEIKEDEEDEEEESTSVQKSPKDAQTSKSKLSLKNIKNEQIEESDDDKVDDEEDKEDNNDMEDKEDNNEMENKEDEDNNEMENKEDEESKKKVSLKNIRDEQRSIVLSEEETRRKQFYMTQLFVMNFPDDITTDELKAVSKDVIFCFIPKNGTAKYAFLHFDSKEKAEENLTLLQDKEFKGNKLRVTSHNNHHGILDFKTLFLQRIPYDVEVHEVAQHFPKCREVKINEMCRYAKIRFSEESDASESFLQTKSIKIRGLEVFVLHSEFIQYSNKYIGNDGVGVVRPVPAEFGHQPKPGKRFKPSCGICNKVFSSRISLEQHLEGRKHKLKFEIYGNPTKKGFFLEGWKQKRAQKRLHQAKQL